MGVIFILIGLLSLHLTTAFDELPCHFLDSINITGGIRYLHDDSIRFNDIIYPKNQYAQINYVLQDGTDKATVDPYIRGCICNIKPCLRLCCPLGSLFTLTDIETTVCTDHDKARNFQAEVLHENNEVKVVPLENYFTYVEGHPCKFLYAVDDYNLTHVRSNDFQLYKLYSVYFEIIKG